MIFPIFSSLVQKQTKQTMRQKVDQRAGQLSLPHVGITKTEK